MTAHRASAEASPTATAAGTPAGGVCDLASPSHIPDRRTPGWPVERWAAWKSAILDSLPQCTIQDAGCCACGAVEVKRYGSFQTHEDARAALADLRDEGLVVYVVRGPLRGWQRTADVRAAAETAEVPF